MRGIIARALGLRRLNSGVNEVDRIEEDGTVRTTEDGTPRRQE